MELLEKHFDIAFAAPDGIKKLRELILTLAMQGKLMQQNQDDQPASVLLKEIEAEKKRLVKKGEIKAPKPLPEIKLEEAPFELPKGWEWVRLGDVSEVNGGFAFKSSKYTNDGMRVIRISDFDEKGFKNDKVVRYQFSDVLRNFKLEPNNILMAMTGGTVGKSLLVKELPEPMVVNQRVATIRIFPGVIPEYINSLIQTNLIQSVIHSAKNSTNDNISMGDITGFLVPLPPFFEQRRIVEKIDQLMARCDELEKLRNEREQKRINVHTSALNRLLSAQESNIFTDAWQFIAKHFGELYSVKENVAELRMTILQLAVLGKLTTPFDSNTPVTSLIQNLQREQNKNSSIKNNDKEHIQNLLENAFSNVSKNRVNLAARTFCEFITKGTTPSANELTETGDIPFLKVYNIVNNSLDFDYKPSFVSFYTHRNTLKRSIILPGDVIMNIVGPPLGKVAIVTDQFSEWNMNQALAVFRPLAGISNKYIYYMLSTFSVLKSVLRDVKGTAGQDNLSLEQCRDLDIPIPSIEEQHRIVAIIDKLMSLCDELDKQIDASTQKQTTLLNAVMAQVR